MKSFKQTAIPTFLITIASLAIPGLAQAEPSVEMRLGDSYGGRTPTKNVVMNILISGSEARFLYQEGGPNGNQAPIAADVIKWPATGVKWISNRVYMIAGGTLSLAQVKGSGSTRYASINFVNGSSIDPNISTATSAQILMSASTPQDIELMLHQMDAIERCLIGMKAGSSTLLQVHGSEYARPGVGTGNGLSEWSAGNVFCSTQ